MARSVYKGFDLPDGAEVPDIPADLRKVVDSGPIGRFTNLAALTAAIAAPAVGTTAIITSTGQLVMWCGSSWRLPWSHPWGRIAASTPLASNSTPIVGPGNVPGMGVTPFTHPAQRRLRIVATGTVATDAVNSEARLGINVDTTQLAFNTVFNVLASRGVACTVMADYTVPDSATRGYQATIARAQGTGNAYVAQGSYLFVDDIGPVPGSAPS